MPKFGLELVPTSEKLIGFVEGLKGIEYIWVTDHYTNLDPFVVLTRISQISPELKLGLGITNPYLRHPACIASGIASLNTISGGRAILGIGPGDGPTLSTLGIQRESPVERVEEAVNLIRRLLAGETLTHSGIFKLEKARLNIPPQKIPIYIGAQSPRMLELAARIGDGVLMNASHPRDFREAISIISRAAEKSGRDVSQLDLAAYTCFSVDVDPERARAAAAPVVAFILGSISQRVASKHGISMDKVNQISQLISQGKIKDAISMVDDRDLEEFSISGDPSSCLEKIQSILDEGVTQLVFGSPWGSRRKDALELITHQIIPKLSG